MSLSKCEFCDDWRIEIVVLRGDANEIFVVLYIFFLSSLDKYP